MTDSGSDAFEKLVALLNYPMFVITTEAGGVTAGCLVGFASQTSIHPPRFLVGLSKRNHTFRVAADATHLAVHVFDREHLDVVGTSSANARSSGDPGDPGPADRRRRRHHLILEPFYATGPGRGARQHDLQRRRRRGVRRPCRSLVVSR